MLPAALTDHVPVVHERVERAEDLGLGGQRLVAEVAGPIDHLPPAAAQLLHAGGIRVADVVAVQLPGQRRQPGPRVGDQRDARVLPGVERSDVQVDEPDAGAGEGGARGGGEIAVPGADAEYHVGLAGQRVGHREPVAPTPPTAHG